MTIKEALEKRIPRIRKQAWSAVSYLRLPLLKDGKTGPWAELYDRPGQLAIGEKVGSQRILLMGDALNDDGFFPYQEKPDAAEQENFAKTYTEE